MRCFYNQFRCFSMTSWNLMSRWISINCPANLTCWEGVEVEVTMAKPEEGVGRREDTWHVESMFSFLLGGSPWRNMRHLGFSQVQNLPTIGPTGLCPFLPIPLAWAFQTMSHSCGESCGHQGFFNHLPCCAHWLPAWLQPYWKGSQYGLNGNMMSMWVNIHVHNMSCVHTE